MKLLLLADGPRMAYRTLRAAAGAGAEVNVLGAPAAGPLGLSRFTRSLRRSDAPFDENDPDAMVGDINRAIEASGAQMVLAGDPGTTRFLIATAERLAAPRFPGPDLATFDLLNDKARFTRLAQDLGLACPRTRLFADAGLAAAALAAGDLTQPSIVKPLSQSGGVGVIRLDGETAPQRLAGVDYAPVLWQSLERGLDVDVNIYCQEGRVVSFVAYRRERGVYHFYDPPGVRREVEAIAARLGLTGIYNFDVIADEALESVRWLECNPRVFFTIDMLAFVGLNVIACGLPGADEEALRAGHRATLAALAGRRLRKANALALDTLRLGRVESLDWKFLAHALSDPLPAASRLLPQRTA